MRAVGLRNDDDVGEGETGGEEIDVDGLCVEPSFRLKSLPKIFFWRGVSTFAGEIGTGVERTEGCWWSSPAEEIE